MLKSYKYKYWNLRTLVCSVVQLTWWKLKCVWGRYYSVFPHALHSKISHSNTLPSWMNSIWVIRQLKLWLDRLSQISASAFQTLSSDSKEDTRVNSFIRDLKVSSCHLCPGYNCRWHLNACLFFKVFPQPVHLKESTGLWTLSVVKESDRLSARSAS